MIQLPNFISALRLAASPVILYLAWHGYADTVLVVLVAALASDALDGYLARALGQTSTFGAKLDSAADFALFITIPLVGWRLWPHIIRHEAPYFMVAIISATLPPAIHFWKFRTSTSYHTWSAKLTVLFVGGSAILLFAGWSPWLFRLATPISVLAACEQIALTWMLPESRSDVRSLWHVTRQTRGQVVKPGVTRPPGPSL